MTSIAARLNLGLTLSLALLIAAAWWLGHDALHRSTDAYVLSRLQHDAEALLGLLRKSPDDPAQLSAAGTMPIHRQPFSGHYFTVLSDNGDQLRSRSLWDQSLDIQPLPAGTVKQWQEDGPLGQRLLVRSAGYQLVSTNDSRHVTVAVAEDLTPMRSVLRGFERLFAVLAVTGLGLMVLIQRIIVSHAFQDLKRVYRDIDGLERGTKRNLTEQVPTEILPLVQKLNGLLAVYDKRLSRSRNAAGNLAHAIKTPLNVMLQQLDRRPKSFDREGRQICREQVQRVRDLAERQLKRARIAGGGTAGSVFDPTTELPILRDLLTRMYPGKRLELQCELALEHPLAADREDMLELVGTLLDNACKWASSRVRCRLEPTHDGIRLSIDDDGPGCDDDGLSDIRERGARLDERIAGHGLGLSIAAEIVELYGGQLQLGRSELLGGFSANVTLPLRQATGETR